LSIYSFREECGIRRKVVGVDGKDVMVGKLEIRINDKSKEAMMADRAKQRKRNVISIYINSRSWTNGKQILWLLLWVRALLPVRTGGEKMKLENIWEEDGLAYSFRPTRQQ
jgi:hypothetical protein